MTTTRAWHLESRPQGLPNMDNFALKPLSLPALEDGWIRVENQWLSVDPYMRGRMNDVKSYVPPFALGEPMQGGAVGKVFEYDRPISVRGNRLPHVGLRDRRWPAEVTRFRRFRGSHCLAISSDGATAYFVC